MIPVLLHGSYGPVGRALAWLGLGTAATLGAGCAEETDAEPSTTEIQYPDETTAEIVVP